MAVDPVMVQDLISFASCFHLPKILDGLPKAKLPDYHRLHFEFLLLALRQIGSIRLDVKHKCYLGCLGCKGSNQHRQSSYL